MTQMDNVVMDSDVDTPETPLLDLHSKLCHVIEHGTLHDVENIVGDTTPDDVCQVCEIHTGINNETLLHRLVELGKENASKMMKTLILRMNESEDYCTVDALQERDGIEDSKTYGGHSVLHKAVEAKNIEMIQTILDMLDDDCDDQYYLINTHTYAVVEDEYPCERTGYNTVLHIADEEITKICLASISCESDRLLLLLEENGEGTNVIFRWLTENVCMVDYILSSVIQSDKLRLRLLISTNSIQVYDVGGINGQTCLQRAVRYKLYEAIDMMVRYLSSESLSELVLAKEYESSLSAAFLVQSEKSLPYMAKLMSVLNRDDKMKLVTTATEYTHSPTVFHHYLELSTNYDGNKSKLCAILGFYFDAFTYTDLVALLAMKSVDGKNAVQVVKKLNDSIFIQLFQDRLKAEDWNLLSSD